MKFVVENFDNLEVPDKEISELLSQVFVQDGFTTVEVAERVFNPVTVKSRGIMFVARETLTNAFCGMIIVVPPTSSAVVRAINNECEIHLLGVKSKFRGLGLGRKLVTKAIEFVEENKWSKIILWTQRPMLEAQNLYESIGFIQTDTMIKSEIDFIVYEKQMS